MQKKSGQEISREFHDLTTHRTLQDESRLLEKIWWELDTVK